MYIRNDSHEMSYLPSEGCFEVDDLIAPAISLLNKKGYVTSACCSGHIDKGYSVAYIQFGFGEMTPEYLPSGWHWVENGQQMEHKYEIMTPLLIKSVMSALTNWADSLPNAAD